MIFFQVPLNFDPVREILKIRCQISVLMKKVIIDDRKIDVTIKSFAPPFFSYFNLSLNRKKSVVMRAMRKKNKRIHVSAADLQHIRKGNLDWCKCEYRENEAKEIDCLCCKEVDAMLIASAKIPARKGSILLQYSVQLTDTLQGGHL